MKSNIKLATILIGAGLALAASGPVTAQDGANAVEAEDACAAPPVSESKAKNITHQHFIDLGYTQPFGSTKTYRVGSAYCEDGKWRIKVRVGDGSQVPNATVYMLVNCHTGILAPEPS